jgi:hypothetical protein
MVSKLMSLRDTYLEQVVRTAMLGRRTSNFKESAAKRLREPEDHGNAMHSRRSCFISFRWLYGQSC